MIVFLEITPDEFDSMDSEDREDLFRKVADSSIKGYHFFVINENLYDRICNLPDLEHDDKSHIRTLIENYSFEDYSNIKLNKIHLDIVPGYKKPERKKFKWKIGHHEIIRGNYLEKCKLIVEYKTDKKFYEYLFRKYGEIQKRNYSELTILEFDTIGCKGSDTGDIFHKKIGKNYTVCCICDSDKLSPNGEFGETYKHAERLSHDCDYLGSLLGTPCRESENFLSVDIIKKLCKEKFGNQTEHYENKLSIINELENYVKSQSKVGTGDCLWLYFDIKSGLCGESLEKKLKDSCETKDWLCKKYIVKNVEEINIGNINEKVIKWFIGSGKSQSEFNDFMRRSKYWKLHFSEWSEEIIWYFCGYEEPV